MPRATQFRTKHEAQNKRRHAWACLHCDGVYESKQAQCPQCGGQIQYFPSQAELRRFRALRLEMRCGHIQDLELQPAFSVVINSTTICTYRADFQYTRGEQRVIEDVKGTTNEKYLDPVFLLKRKLVEAVHGISINIVRG